MTDLSTEKTVRRPRLLMGTMRAEVERWADATGLDAQGIVDACRDLDSYRSELLDVLWWGVLCNNTDEIHAFLKAESTDEDPDPELPDDAPEEVYAAGLGGK